MSRKKAEERKSGITEILSGLKPAVSSLRDRAAKADEYLDQLQRLQAEFVNFRKRITKDKEEFRKYALEGFIFDLLLVLDNLQRALASGRENHNYQSLCEGIGLVEKQFLDILKNAKVLPINAAPGDKFNPHEHDAVSHESSAEYSQDTIIKQLLPGYRIVERVLRPATVVVSSGQ